MQRSMVVTMIQGSRISARMLANGISGPTRKPAQSWNANCQCFPEEILFAEAHMTGQLSGRKVAILVADGFEQVELTEPKAALEKAGAETHIVSLADKKVKGWKHTEWGDEFQVDRPL